MAVWLRDQIGPEHRRPHLVSQRRQMQTVLDVRILAWLLVPAEHQVVEIQKGKAVVSLTNCSNDIVCSPHPVNLQPAEGLGLIPM